MIAFVVNQFPRQVDAYFLRELVGLADRGLDFVIYSLLRAPLNLQTHGDAASLAARTIYPSALPTLATGLGRALAQQPRQIGGGLARVAWGHRRMPVALAKSAAVAPQSVAFAADAAARGVRHLHANWATYPATATYLMSRMTGIPFSFSGHATDIFVHRAMLREKIEAARFVLTCTKFNRGYLAETAPGCADRIETIYHGVDLDRFASKGAPRSRKRILSVGTLRSCKGFDDLIHAVALMRTRGRDVELEIIGDGEERANLEQLVASLGLSEHVRLPGYLPQENVVPAYQTAAVVALPAHHEDHFGIPNILIEGLAAGAPVVCTELPSLGELIEHERSGLFVPERDPAALAAAMERIFDRPDWAAQLAEVGRRRVAESFDIRRTVDRLAARLQEAERAAEAA